MKKEFDYANLEEKVIDMEKKNVGKNINQFLVQEFSDSIKMGTLANESSR